MERRRADEGDRTDVEEEGRAKRRVRGRGRRGGGKGERWKESEVGD